MKLCVIPARGGSKRIPKKNIKHFHGKPIIAYSIEAALQSKCFDHVIVSTDDKAIANISLAYGAEVPFFRPLELANDFAGTLPVIKHAIEFYTNQHIDIDHVCCLYSTAPFVDAEILLSSYKKFLKSDVSYCFSVCEFNSPVQRSFVITEEGRVKMREPDFFNHRSQDMEPVFYDAGQFYWGTKQAFLDELPSFGEYTLPYVLPKTKVQDIDTQEDWIIAEIMYRTLME